jgi:hypothetical protein
MLGKILFGVAAVILFLAGIGSTLVPNPQNWALFCMALGLLLGDHKFLLSRR